MLPGALPIASPGMPLIGNTPLAPPGGAGPGGGGMEALDALAGMPFGKDGDQAIQDAVVLIQKAMQGYQLRSPKAAKLLSEAVSKCQAAREEVKQSQQGPLGMPPNLLGGMSGGPGSPPPMMGGMGL